VPDSAIAQDGSPGTDAVAWAVQVTVDPERVPVAVPLIFRSPVHVALNVPLALLPVCCVTVHVKSEQALDDGIGFEDVQVPSNAAAPVGDGPVVVERSWPQAHVAKRQTTTKILVIG
jgi:hypothetical protein